MVSLGGNGMSEPVVEVGADDIRPAPKRSGHRLFDLLMALTAIFISAVSLFVAIEHGHTQQRLVAANSWPFLQIGGSVSEKGTALVVTNAGTGPAKIEYVQVFYKGKPLSSPQELLKRLGIPGGSYKASINSVDETVLRSGEDAVLFGLGVEKDADAWRRFVQGIPDVTYKACYCSIFDECWLSDGASMHPTAVKACPANDHPFSSRDMLKQL